MQAGKASRRTLPDFARDQEKAPKDSHGARLLSYCSVTCERFLALPDEAAKEKTRHGLPLLIQVLIFRPRGDPIRNGKGKAASTRKADGRHATTAQEGTGAVFKMLTWKSKDRRKKRDSGAGQRRKRLILSLRGLQEMKRFYSLQAKRRGSRRQDGQSTLPQVSPGAAHNSLMQDSPTDHIFSSLRKRPRHLMEV